MKCDTLLQGQGRCCTGGSGAPGCMAPLDCCKFRNSGCTTPPPKLAPAPAPLIAEPLALITPGPAPIEIAAPAPAPVIIQTPALGPVIIEAPVPAPVVVGTPAPAPIVEVSAPAPVLLETQPPPAAVKDVFLTRARVVHPAAQVPAPAPAPRCAASPAVCSKCQTLLSERLILLYTCIPLCVN